MWLGVTAGPFTLLVIWLFARPAQSSQVTFSDQQLTYLGTGWKTVDSPPACSQVSRTMHTTSTTGDSVSFRFIGTGVIVRGPITSRSIPLVIALDGAVQPLAAPKNCTNGCGTLYINGNLTNSPHTLQIGYTSLSGTADLTICGISLFLNGQDPSLIPTLPTANGYGDQPGVPAPNPTSTTPSFPPGFMEARITPTTLIGIIVAVVGTVFLMVIVLFFCVVIRRRVSRNAARSRDRENSCHREKVMEAGISDKLTDLSRLQSWNSTSFKESLSECVIIASSASSINSRTTSFLLSNPQPVASGSGTRPMSISSATQTFIQTNHDSDTRHVVYLPAEHEDQFVLPSPQSDRTDRFLLRYSIPIGLYSPESRPQSIVENPFASPGLLTPSLTTRSSVVAERDLSNDSTSF